MGLTKKLCTLSVLAGGLLGSACARDVIPNTTVEDTSENREVLEFLEEYRVALVERDIPRLLRLVHPDYFDDNGTPGAADDIDYTDLQDKLALWATRLEDVRYDIRYRDVIFTEADRILVDYTYAGRFKVVGPDGESRWARRLDSNRIVLRREDGGAYRIVSGL